MCSSAGTVWPHYFKGNYEEQHHPSQNKLTISLETKKTYTVLDAFYGGHVLHDVRRVGDVRVRDLVGVPSQAHRAVRHSPYVARVSPSLNRSVQYMRRWTPFAEHLSNLHKTFYRIFFHNRVGFSILLCPEEF